MQILFRLQIPINMKDVLGPILELTNFDIFHTDDLFLLIFGFGETESFDSVFEDNKFEGSNFIVGIGPLFIIIVFYAVWIPVQVLLKWIIRKRNIKKGKALEWATKHSDRRW